MFKKIFVTVFTALIVVGFVAAEEFDAVVDNASRDFTKRLKSDEKLVFGRLTLDSKGKVVSTVYKEGKVTKDTKVLMGTYDEKTKKTTPGEVIEGGIASDLFKDKGKVLRLRVTVGDDKTTVSRILVTNTDEKLVLADLEFDAILKRRGAQTNGAGPISYVRTELDEKGKVIKEFPLTTTMVSKDTKVVMGKYNEKEKTWEAGAEIENALYNPMFGDFSAKTVYVRMTLRDDRRGIAQILVRRIGEQSKK
jgi:hypothetical protein